MTILSIPQGEVLALSILGVPVLCTDSDLPILVPAIVAPPIGPDGTYSIPFSVASGRNLAAAALATVAVAAKRRNINEQARRYILHSEAWIPKQAFNPHEVDLWRRQHASMFKTNDASSERRGDYLPLSELPHVDPGCVDAGLIILKVMPNDDNGTNVVRDALITLRQSTRLAQWRDAVIKHALHKCRYVKDCEGIEIGKRPHLIRGDIALARVSTRDACAYVDPDAPCPETDLETVPAALMRVFNMPAGADHARHACRVAFLTACLTLFFPTCKHSDPVAAYIDAGPFTVSLGLLVSTLDLPHGQLIKEALSVL